MKWFYEWRLKRVRAEISALESETKVRLLDDYTGHSRLRVLRKMASGLQKRLARYQNNVPAKSELKKPNADLNQTT